jgi:hypothetical protein
MGPVRLALDEPFKFGQYDYEKSERLGAKRKARRLRSEERPVDYVGMHPTTEKGMIYALKKNIDAIFKGGFTV